MLLGHDGFLYLLAGGSSLCVVTVWMLTVTATLPVLLLASTFCNYYSTTRTPCATMSCPPASCLAHLGSLCVC